ncbi:hypothetical protein TREES_T100000767 [Tupaia chinensis]|uniref:Uncharacterized protein n=1 Tax=Tupaia chinensis TaxID=246437 RepID=L9KNK9_TUPCH|nr:hypothetical protein TREES_T100000767 [Tupaia chinensis]
MQSAWAPDLLQMDRPTDGASYLCACAWKDFFGGSHRPDEERRIPRDPMPQSSSALLQPAYKLYAEDLEVTKGNQREPEQARLSVEGSEGTPGQEEVGAKVQVGQRVSVAGREASGRNRSIYTDTRRLSPDWSVFSAEEAVFVLVYSYPGAKGQAHLHSSMQASGIQQA